MMHNALVVGGNSGIGLSIVNVLLKNNYNKVYVVGKNEIELDAIDDSFRRDFEERVVFVKTNLVTFDETVFDRIEDIDTLIITAGFGRVSLFENLKKNEIDNLMRVNFESCIKIVKHYYENICSEKDFYTAIIASISGHIVSPFFSVYGACKAGVRFFIENINCELSNKNIKNRVLEVSPGSLKGTAFNGGATSLPLTLSISRQIVEKMLNRECLFIPDYDSVYSAVIKKYIENPIEFGKDSYNYKINSGRISDSPQVVVGYLSGTFDLFHVGHLNLLKRAKEQCDYLIVSVHDSGAWKGKETFIPYEERRAIVESNKYVDLVVDDFKEDYDAWMVYHYNKLFVGSDYKGTDRFNKYEELLKDKAEIIYFPYTKGTSSTQLREALKRK